MTSTEELNGKHTVHHILVCIQFKCGCKNNSTDTSGMWRVDVLPKRLTHVTTSLCLLFLFRGCNPSIHPNVTEHTPSDCQFIMFWRVLNVQFNTRSRLQNGP